MKGLSQGLRSRGDQIWSSIVADRSHWGPTNFFRELIDALLLLHVDLRLFLTDLRLSSRRKERCHRVKTKNGMRQHEFVLLEVCRE